MRSIKLDSAWGHYTDEHRFQTDGDNRGSFLAVLGTKHSKNREHLLYLWHLVDMHGILHNVLNVLAKDVAVDGSGRVSVGDITAVKYKRKQTLDKEAEKKEQRAVRHKLGSAFDVFAAASTQDSITNKRAEIARLEKELANTEISMLKESSKAVQKVYKKLYKRQMAHIKVLTEEIVDLKARDRSLTEHGTQQVEQEPEQDNNSVSSGDNSIQQQNTATARKDDHSSSDSDDSDD